MRTWWMGGQVRWSAIGSLKRTRIGWTIWVLLTALAALDIGSPTTSAQDARRPDYWRVYWPADELARLQGRFLPMARELFERRLAELDGRPPVHLPPLADHQRWIVWRAEMHGSSLRGQAQLRLELPPGQEHQWLTLSIPSGMAVEDLRWTELPVDGRQMSEPTSGQQTLAGERPVGGFDGQGRLHVLHDRSAVLVWNWSLSAQDREAQVPSFRLALPGSWWHRFQIDVPVDRWLEPHRSFLALSPSETSEGANTGGRRFELIALPESDLMLRFARLAGRTARALRQHTRHVISPAGVATSTRWELPRGAETSLLAAEIPAGMTVTQVRWNGMPLAWFRPRADRLVVEVADEPEVASAAPPGTGELWIDAHSPWSVGEFSTLPRLRLEEFVAHEDAEVEIQTPLVVSDMALHEARYVGPRGGEPARHTFSLDEGGTIDIKVDWEDVQYSVISGISVQLDSSVARAQVIADVTIDRGTLYFLRIGLRPGWVVDTVTAATNDQQITRWGVAEDEDGRWLEIRLRQGVTPESPLQLVIDAQLPGRFLDDPEPLTLPRLRPVDWQLANTVRQWFSLRTSYPYRLETLGPAAVDWLASESLSSHQRQLLNVQAGNWLVEDQPANWEFQFRLTQQQPSYLAQIQVQVSVEQDRCVQRHRISIEPASSASPLRRLAVVCYPAQGPELQWQLESRPSANVVARRLVDEAAAPSGSGGERWEIELPEALREPFVLVAERTVPLDGEQRIALSAVPDASDQNATVVVAFLEPVAAQVATRGAMQPLPIERGAIGSAVRARRRYAYPPDQILQSELRLIADSAACPPGGEPLWAWLAQVRTQYSRSGAAKQQVRLLLENLGVEQLEVQVRPDAVVRRLEIGSRPVRWTERRGTLIVPLPSDLRFPEIRLELDLNLSPLPSWSDIQLEAPRLNIPVLKWQWLTWLPPGFMARTMQPDRQILVPFDLPASEVPPMIGSLGAPAGAHHAPSGDTGNAASAEVFAAHPDDALLASNGWAPVLQEGHVPRLRIAIYRPVPLQMFAGVAFLCALGVYSTFLTGRPRLAAATAAIGGGLWLAAPPPVSLAAGAMTLGLLLGGLLYATRRVPSRLSRGRGGRWTDSVATSSVSAHLIAALFLGGVLLDRTTIAAPQDGASGMAVIPTDQDGQPAGEYVYLSEDLYERLVAADEPRAVGPAWWYEEASYHVEDVSANRLTGESYLHVRALLRLTTRLPQQQLVLPLPASSVQQVRLDGRVVRWSATSSDAVQIECPESGQHQVEIALRVAARHEGDQRMAQLSIPMIPSAQLTADWPPEFGLLEVGPVADVPTWSGDHRMLSAILSGTDRLTFRWQAGRPPNPTVDQVTWLRVTDQQVTAEVRFRVTYPGAAPTAEQLVVLSDQPLRPFTPAVTASGEPAVGNPSRRFVVPLEPLANRGQFRAVCHFLIELNEGWIDMPTVRPEGAEMRRHLLGLSVSPGLGCYAEWLDTLTPATTAAFESIWGTSETRPDSLLVWDGPADARQLMVRYQPLVPELEGVLQYTIDNEQTAVSLETLVRPAGFGPRHLRLRVPEACSVRHVDVVQNGQQRRVWWSRSDPEMISIFLDVVGREEYSLLVRGQMPTVRGQPYSLPLLGFPEYRWQGFRLRVYEQNQTLVSLVRQGGFQEVAPAVEELPGEWLTAAEPDARLAADLVAVAANPLAEIAVVPNKPVARHDLVLDVTLDERGWSGRLEHRVQVEQGELREVRYEIPAEWAGRLVVSDSLRTRTRPTLRADRVQLLVRLDPPVRDEARWEIQVPLSATSGDQIRVPLVELLHDARISGMIVVPATAGQRPIEWVATTGLQEVDSDDDTSPGVRRFRVLNRSYRLTGNVRRPTAPARSPQAEMAAEWLGRGGTIAWFHFDLHPGGTPAVTLRLPNQARLIQVLLEDAPALIRKVGESAWQLPLGPANLPQRVSVLVMYAGAGRRGTFELEFPELNGPDEMPIRPERWLMAVTAPASAGAPRGSPVYEPLTRVRLHELRREHLERLLEVGAPAAALETSAGMSSWRTRLEAVEQQLQQALSQHDGSERLETRAGTAPMGEGSLLHPSMQGWPRSDASAKVPTFLAAPGDIRRLTLHYPQHPEAREARSHRWLPLAMFLIGAVWLLRTQRWEWIESQWQRWFPAVVVLVGLLLSQTVWPGWLGWLLAATGVWMAWQPIVLAGRG